MTDPDALIQAHKQVDSIKVGDRVTWEQRPARDRLPAKMLTGVVRSFKRADEGGIYAVIATDPDGRITMPGRDRLTKLEATP